MIDLNFAENQIQCVTTFHDLVSTAFCGNINTICWNRKLIGDFSEIVNKVETNENIIEINQEDLYALQLSEQGRLARDILLDDLKLLKKHGAAPTINLIKSYERDDSFPFFPTDVYSFHVDRSPIPVDTYLCTYYGESSEILPNSQAHRKVFVPEIREELKKIYDGTDEGFESFLTEYFFDLHFLPKPSAKPISLGLGNLCKIATEHPKSKVLPCVHRAPKEKNGQKRLLLIC